VNIDSNSHQKQKKDVLKQEKHNVKKHVFAYLNRERKCADTINTVPILGSTISNAKILMYFSNAIYGSNFMKQHSQAVMV